MKINIEIGTRGTVSDFLETYCQSFLEQHGWFFRRIKFSNIELIGPILFTVITKHGEIVVHKDDILTYVGHNVWDVRPKEITNAVESR